MANSIVKAWRLVVWLGILAILLGTAIFLWRGLTGFHLIPLFGAYALADGMIAAGATLSGARNPLRWWALLAEGVVSMVAGIIALLRPDLVGWMLVVLITLWAVVTGILELVAALRLRNSVVNDWLLAWGGALSIALGVIAFFQPGPGDDTLIWGMGAYGLSFGAILLILGFGLRRYNVRSDRRFLHPAGSDASREIG